MEDLQSHVDFEGWQFISNKDAHNQNINIDQAYAKADNTKPVVVFGSFQDLLGTNDNGGIKAKNEFIHSTNWDIVIFDEYHFGAWRENAKKLFDNPDEEEEVDFDQEKYKQNEADNAYNETFLPIQHILLLLHVLPYQSLCYSEIIRVCDFDIGYLSLYQIHLFTLHNKNLRRICQRLFFLLCQ